MFILSLLRFIILIILYNFFIFISNFDNFNKFIILWNTNHKNIQKISKNFYFILFMLIKYHAYRKINAKIQIKISLV